MQVVILAAGMGTRLKGLTADRPKTLLDLNGRPLLDYILASLDTPEVSEILVVGGFAFGRLQAYLETYRTKPVQFFVNDYFRAGSLYTLEKALPSVTGDFLLLNGDHVHPRAMIKRFLQEAKGVAGAIDYDRSLGDDDMKVRLSGNKHITEIDKKLTTWDAGYIGMTLVRADQLERYRQGLLDARTAYGDTANVERILGVLGTSDDPPMTVDCSGIGWFEVDTPDDLELARWRLRENPHLADLAID